MMRRPLHNTLVLLAVYLLACGEPGLTASPNRWDWSAKQPIVVWRAEIGSGFGSVAVQDKTVFAFGNVADEDRVTALDVDTGQMRWQYRYPCRAIGIAKPDELGPRATPVALGNKVYTLSRDGRLLCLKASDGQLEWWLDVPAQLGEKPPYWGFASSPLVWKELLVWSVGENGLAVKADNGQVAWKSQPRSSAVWKDEPVGVSSYASPQLFSHQGREFIALANEKEFVVVEPSSGQRVWATAWSVPYGVTAAMPAIVGDRVVLSGGYGFGTRMVKLFSDEPPVWAHKRLRSHTANLVVVGDYLYGIDGNQQDGEHCQLRCIRLADGEVVWSKERFGFGNLILVENRLVVLKMQGELTVVTATPAGYNEEGRFQVLDGQSWTAPFISGNRLFVRNKQGTLVRLDLP